MSPPRGAMVKAYDGRNRRAALVLRSAGAARAAGGRSLLRRVNRGVAVWGDSLFVGTLDGRLVALDAATGAPAWSVQSPIDQSKPYTITGAPRVIDGRVIIGNGGAEFGVRGYVTAYDAATGDLLWRFYTVPGNPADGFEAEPSAPTAAKTWTRRMVDARRRRHGLGLHGLRSGAQPALHRRRQRLALEPAISLGRAAATISSSSRSSRSDPTPANMSGITRRRPARPGTTPPPST